MSRGIRNTFILAGCFLSACGFAVAQEVVHALSGTVSSVNWAAKTITIITDDGSEGTFKAMTSPKTLVEFDKSLRADATAADAFNKKEARAILYYFGYGNERTAVALHDLGPGPFTKSSGTVVKFDKGERSLSIKNQAWAVESFKFTRSTVADTGSGATEGLKFDPRRAIKFK